MKNRLIYLLVLGVLLSACQNTNEAKQENSKTNNTKLNSKENSNALEIEKENNSINNTGIENINNEAKNSSEDFSYKAYPNIDYSSLSPKIQSFIINPLQDSEIETKAKVKLFIPANCLVYENGNQVTGTVNFEITEYFNYFDLVAENLTTNHKMGHLESSGMFLIEAKANGKKLKLKEFTELILQLPNKVDKNMMIYYGNRNGKGKLIWNLDAYSDQPYPSMICKSGRFCGVTSLFFERQFRFTKKNMIELEGDSMEYSLSFDKKGYVIGTAICKNPDNPIKDEACFAFMKLANRLRDSFPNTMNSNHKVIFEFEAMNYKTYKEYREIKRREWLAFQEKMKEKNNSKEVRKSLITTIRKDNNAEQFVRKNQPRKSFFIGGLGFLNIDMELKLPDAPSGEIIVNETGIKKELMLLFQNKTSFLTPTFYDGNKYTFTKLPRNENVVLIACYKKDGKVFFSSQKIKTEKQTNLFIKNFQFEELKNLEEMKKRINKI